MKKSSLVSIGLVLFASFAVLMVKLTFWPSANETDLRSFMATVAMGTLGVLSFVAGAVRSKFA